MKKILLFFFCLIIIALQAQDGVLDLNFNTGSGSNGTEITEMGLQKDGKIIVIGDFTTYDNFPRKGIARLNSNGSIDESFNPGSGFEGMLRDLIIQEDGKIIVVGHFTKFNDISKKYIVRLNTDGSLDTTFNPLNEGPSDKIHSITQQADGKITIVGDFETYNGSSRQKLARLNHDGTLDPSLNSGIIGTNVLSLATIQPDGKILTGGYLINYNNTIIKSIVRLHSDGSLDSSFNYLGAGAELPLQDITVQPDGKIIICGTFNWYNNIETGGIVRLNKDGTLDNTFAKKQLNLSNSAIILPNEKILTNGTINYQTGLVRLNSDGSIDKSFKTDSYIEKMTLQPDGKILICGKFKSYDGVIKNQIARINGENILATSEKLNVNYEIYPNPAKDILNIKANRTISGYEIYSMDGKKILFDEGSNKNKINISKLIKGNYILKLKTDLGFETAKFSKE